MPTSPAERRENNVTQGTTQPVFAKVASVPEVISDEVFVTIPSFDGGHHKHGPCRWSPRVGGDFIVMFPSIGDEALVVPDEDDDLWIIAWWPY